MDNSFLISAVAIPLTKCLAELVTKIPQDPIEWIAHWLYQYRDKELYYYEKSIFMKDMMRMQLEIEKEKLVRKRCVDALSREINDLKASISEDKDCMVQLLSKRPQLMSSVGQGAKISYSVFRMPRGRQDQGPVSGRRDDWYSGTKTGDKSALSGDKRRDRGQLTDDQYSQSSRDGRESEGDLDDSDYRRGLSRRDGGRIDYDDRHGYQSRRDSPPFGSRRDERERGRSEFDDDRGPRGTKTGHRDGGRDGYGRDRSRYGRDDGVRDGYSLDKSDRESQRHRDSYPRRKSQLSDGRTKKKRQRDSSGDIESSWCLDCNLGLICRHPVLGTMSPRCPLVHPESPELWETKKFHIQHLYDSEIYSTDFNDDDDV